MKARIRIITILVLGSAICMIFVLYWVIPSFDSIKNINESIRTKKAELATLDLQIRSFKNAQTDLAKASRKDDIAKAVVTKETLNLAVEEVESAAAKTGTVEILDIRELDPDAATPPARVINARGIDEVGYSLTIKSDYLGIVNFLSYLEHLPHFTEISKIELSAEVLGNTAGAKIRTGKAMGNIDGVFFIKSVK